MLVTGGVTRLGAGFSTQYSVLGGARFACWTAEGGRPTGRPMGRPHMDGIEATSHRIVASLGIGSFLDGAKFFSSLIWGEGIWGAEMGLEDAKC